MSSNVVDYFATRTPGDVGADILKAIESKWDSLKDEFAALGDDPVKQAEWLGEIAGRLPSGLNIMLRDRIIFIL
jgi:hypothetical protein